MKITPGTSPTGRPADQRSGAGRTSRPVARLWPLLLLLLPACNLQQNIDVVIPAGPAQLVVECYLEDGQVPRLTVTETAPYLAEPAPRLPPGVDAMLTLPDGTRQSLGFLPGRDPVTGKAFTHRGTQPLRSRPGDTFGLEVSDAQGRRVTSTATMPPVVPLDTVEYPFNAQSKAAVLSFFRDPPGLGNAYRLLIHRSNLRRAPETDIDLSDRLNDGDRIALGTSFEFERGDTMLVTLFHLDPAYFRYLESVGAAQRANGNPFGQPAAVRSTVRGGVGVFTVLQYQRQTVILR